jgi:O-antigen/teichoic acid export membrane protein
LRNTGIDTDMAAVGARPAPDERNPNLGAGVEVVTSQSSSAGSGGVAVLTAANYAAQGTRLVFSVVIAQVFGPVGRGAVALIAVLDEASSILLTGGVPPAAGYRAKIGASSDSALMSAALRLGLISLPLVLPLAFAIGIFFLGALEPPVRWITVLLIAWTGLVNLPSLTGMNLMQAHRDLTGLAVYNVLFGSVTLAVVLVLLLAGHLTLLGVGIGIAAGRLASSLYAAARVAWPKLRGAAPLRPLLSYGIRALPGTTSMLVNNRFDQLLIAPLVDLHALGLYAVAAGTSFLPTVPANSVASASFSAITHDSHLGRQAVASTAIRRGLLVSAVVAAGLAALAPLAVPLVYGSDFQGAVLPTILLLVGSVPWGGQIVARQCGNALGYPGFGSVGEVAGLVVTVAGLAAAVPFLGILGAALVSLAAYVVRFGTTMLLLRRNAGVRGVVPGFDDARWLVSRSWQTARSATGFSPGKRHS